MADVELHIARVVAEVIDLESDGLGKEGKYGR